MSGISPGSGGASLPHASQPGRAWRAKQFDLWQLGVHLLDERIGFIGLAAVRATWSVDDRGRAIALGRVSHLAAFSEEQQLVLIPHPISEAQRSVLHPDDAGHVCKTPRRQDAPGALQMR